MSKNGFAAPATREALQTVSDAWSIAVQAAKDGAAQAKASAGEAFPAAGRFVSRMVYTMSYSFSYGTVFPVAFIAKSIPVNNPLVTGMVDGARAANDWVDELKHREPKSLPAPAKRGRPAGTAKTTKKNRKGWK
jgi:hypothetical protein